MEYIDGEHMTKLPEKFKERMKEELGGEYEAFLASYEQESLGGLRVNRGRIAPEKFCGAAPFSLLPVSWTENGYYYEKGEAVTKHPYYYAGLYYVQEPSAMLPAASLPVEPGDLVLDLCAAPGGKATELASKLEGRGLLVANDASASRAKALLKNLTLWGCANCCVTGETPEKLLEAFGCFFDKILVDAPCSGEGMFRKDSGLISSWEERGPEKYAPLQKEILDCAVRMVKPGGMVLYSTCTFAREEDEEVVAEILDRYPEMELVQPAVQEGFAAGYPPCEKAVRLWPHRVKGEGHFLALMRKRMESESCGREAGENIGRKQDGVSLESGTSGKAWKEPGGKSSQSGAAGKLRREPKGKSSQSGVSGNTRNIAEKIPKEVSEFLKLLPERVLGNRSFRQIGDQCLMLPGDVVLPGKLRYLRTGLLLGTWKRERFEPDQALAMVLDADSFPNVLNLSPEDERVIRYLKGETVDLREEERELPKGWVLVCVDGFALGWGKSLGRSVKNKYYPGWRLQ